MACFRHYMYVLACGDGSLYAGYATDVQARLAAHQAGRGAKYTKSHAPVRLLAQARFYSKERAMSAEAHFKRLPRSRKDALIAAAAHEPFEDVLRRELPGLMGTRRENSSVASSPGMWTRGMATSWRAAFPRSIGAESPVCARPT